MIGREQETALSRRELNVYFIRRKAAQLWACGTEGNEKEGKPYQ